MSLMKAHVRYSQGLATEFAHLIQDYEEFVVSELRIEESQLEAAYASAQAEAVENEAACIKLKELMEKEPIEMLSRLRHQRVKKNIEAGVNLEAVKQIYEDLISYNSIDELRSLFIDELRKKQTSKKKPSKLSRNKMRLRVWVWF